MKMGKGKKKLLAALILGMIAVLMVSMSASAAAKYKNKIVTKNGKQYYYNKSGKKVTKKYGYKIKGKYYRIDKNGVLTKVSKAEGLAGIQLNKYYGKSKSTVLYKAFCIAANLKYFANPVKGKGASYFAVYGFEKKRGDCNVQAAMFYYMAKVIGYNPTFVQGYVPTAKNSSGTITKYGAHAWVTIAMNGKTKVFDPNFSGYCKRKKMLKGIKSGYQISYGQKNTYQYYDKNKVKIAES